jgi:hypothetical protein
VLQLELERLWWRKVRGVKRVGKLPCNGLRPDKFHCPCTHASVQSSLASEALLLAIVEYADNCKNTSSDDATCKRIRCYYQQRDKWQLSRIVLASELASWPWVEHSGAIVYREGGCEICKWKIQNSMMLFLWVKKGVELLLWFGIPRPWYPEYYKSPIINITTFKLTLSSLLQAVENSHKPNQLFSTASTTPAKISYGTLSSPSTSTSTKYWTLQ